MYMHNRNTLLKAVDRIGIYSIYDEELVSLLFSKKKSYALDVTDNGEKKVC